MDLETENKLAAILMRQAAELRRQAEKEGTLAYLRQPNIRNRLNSRFLTATVLGAQQANRAVEVNEMWQVRQKELELERRRKGNLEDKNSRDRSHSNGNPSVTARRPIVHISTGASPSCSNTREYEHCAEGLGNEELEDFLHSRIKRGRGAVGPRMDETSPIANPDVREQHIVYGPERPPSLKSHRSSEEELHERRQKNTEKSHSQSSGMEYTKKQRPEENSKHKKKKREEKKRKHRH